MNTTLTIAEQQHLDKVEAVLEATQAAYQADVDKVARLAISVLEQFGLSQRAISRHLELSHSIINYVCRHERHFPLDKATPLCLLVKLTLKAHTDPLSPALNDALGKLIKQWQGLLHCRHNLD